MGCLQNAEIVVLLKSTYDDLMDELRRLRNESSHTVEPSHCCTISDLKAFIEGKGRTKFSVRARKTILRAAYDHPPETLASDVEWRAIRNCGVTCEREILQKIPAVEL